jgi:hypothetical protein
MKPKYLFQILALLLFTATTHAQQGISYKAIIHDANGDPLSDRNVTIQFTILENGTTNVYQETHNPTSDDNGIIIVNIGEGTLLSGDFNAIYWGGSPHFLKTEIDSGEGMTDMGTTEFKAVPYAFYAQEGAGANELNDLDDAKFDGYSLFIGQDAGINDDGTHNYNTAIGCYSLHSNVSGRFNTASGYNALYNNIGGYNNTVTGYSALFQNTTGSGNTAIGTSALVRNISGYRNTAVGIEALENLREGDNNIGIGYYSQVPNNSGSNQVRIGNESITYAGIQVAWTITSDARWKEDIRALPYGLDMIMKLKPVDYIRRNNEERTREMGIIAQDLKKVLEEIEYEDQGFLINDDYGNMHLRYNDLIALSIKAIQDQQAIIKSLTGELDKNKKAQRSMDERLTQLEQLLKTSKL